MKNNKKPSFFESFKKKYRLVILNDKTFEEKFSIKTSFLLFFSAFLIFVLIVVFFSLLLAKNKVGSRGANSEKTQALSFANQKKIDSLNTVLKSQETYINNIKHILSGSVPKTEDYVQVLDSLSLTKQNLGMSENESLFREKIEYLDNNIEALFSPPLIGEITDLYSADKKHFGIDIVSKENSKILSIAPGTVLDSDWTKDGGFSVFIQHEGGFVSIYKHNSKLLKQKGDYVDVGDPIAIIGNTGELSYGLHLHFELWENGESVDPLNYIDFQK